MASQIPIDPIFNHYRAALSSHGLQATSAPQAVVVGQEDLISIIEAVKSSPDKPRHELIDEAFGGRLEALEVGARAEALDLAVNITFMVKCASENPYSGLLEQGDHRNGWKSEDGLDWFIVNLIPNTSSSLGLSVENSGSALDIKTTLKARKLKKRPGLHFRPTNDWSNHLRLDRHHGRSTVLVFNQIAFLKEQLRLTKDGPRMSPIGDCLRR